MANLPPRPIVSASVIWRGKWFIFACMVASLGTAAAYLHHAKPVFEAEARLLVRQKGLQFDRESSFLKDRQFLATEAEILRSEAVLERALQLASPKLPDGYSGDPMTLVLDSLTVTPSPVADVLTVSYRSHSEQDTVAVLRAALDSYQEALHQSEGDDYVSTAKVLAQREQSLRDELKQLQNQYALLRAGSPLVGQGREALNLHTQQLSTLGDRLATARGRKFEIEKKLESFVGFKQKDPDVIQLVVLREIGVELPSEQAVADGVVTASHAELSDMHDVVSLSYTGFGDVALHNSAAAQMFRQQAESKLAQMHDVERQYWLAKAALIRLQQHATHPSYRTAESEVKHWEQLVSQHREDWHRFLQEQVDALHTVLQQELETAAKAESQLEKLYVETQEQAKELDLYLLEEQAIEADIARLESVHGTILARLVDFELADQSVAGGHASVEVRVLEGPELTNHIVWPMPPFVLAGSLLLGCMVPVALLAAFGRPENHR